MSGSHAARALALAPVLAFVLLAACAPPAAPAPTKPAASTTSAPSASSPAPSAAAPAPTVAALAPPPLSPTAQVKFGSTGASTDIGVFIAMDRGYFREEGIETEFVQFSTGPEAIPALVTNEVLVSGG